MGFPDPETIARCLGRRETAQDVCSAQLVQRVALLLDQDPDAVGDGFALPPGWHACLFTPRLRQSELREDGHPREDTLIPALDYPRRMLGGRRTWYHAPLTVGMQLTRTSRIAAIEPKEGRAGAMALVTIEHAIRARGEETPRLVEQQDALFLPAAPDTPSERPSAAPSPAARAPSPPPDFSRTITPDTTMMFRYSAITFNTHRIHYDLPYATGVEGHPGLIVNGGLAALLLTEFLRERVPGPVRLVSARNRSAILCGRTVRMCASRAPQGWRLWIEDDTAKPLLEISVE
mgnify:CR=1 FL=1